MIIKDYETEGRWDNSGTNHCHSKNSQNTQWKPLELYGMWGWHSRVITPQVFDQSTRVENELLSVSLGVIQLRYSVLSYPMTDPSTRTEGKVLPRVWYREVTNLPTLRWLHDPLCSRCPAPLQVTPSDVRSRQTCRYRTRTQISRRTS